jgi:hypothetical protein
VTLERRFPPKKRFGPQLFLGVWHNFRSQTRYPLK